MQSPVRITTPDAQNLARPTLRLAAPRRADVFEALTERELEVLQRIALAGSNEEIAEALFIGVRTVETHIASIYMKLGLTEHGAGRRVAASLLFYANCGMLDGDAFEAMCRRPVAGRLLQWAAR